MSRDKISNHSSQEAKGKTLKQHTCYLLPANCYLFELRKITTFFFLSFFTPGKNASPNYKRDNKSNHEYSNPHNYSLSFTVFFEVHIIPITAHPMETTKPIAISTYCGNSPRNIPPRMKLAKVNFATSSINFPTFSFVFDSVLFTLNNSLRHNITQYCPKVKGTNNWQLANRRAR